jgi:NADPH-dependent 2,4-dienoyl-CoA reductase/sulfur reductase-like enzyme/nitrite reductase/ring-hydroxylating ferredoxin subunit
MGGGTSVSGPDLRAGVRADELPEGAPFAGVVDGEGVVLVRRGEAVHAVGASCSHYGGPLAEGLVVGDTIRCPWHHACFDLQTGGVVGAPALQPIACYDVERDGPLVRVRARRERPVRGPSTGTPGRVLLLGAGAASAACAEALRAGGFDGPITMIGAEQPGPVDRPNLSKDYLAGSAPEEWVPLGGDDRWRALDVTLHADDAVVELDLPARRVRTRSGRELSWDALLYAPGSEPTPPAIPGADRPFVHVLRTLADSRAIAAQAGPGKRAVVVGAGFIGLEAALALRKRETEVVIVAPTGPPLARPLGDELGRFVQSLHEARGVRFRFGARPAEIADGAVRLDDGTTLPADVVVLGTGVRPRTQLAHRAGLRVEDGVVVDAELRASVVEGSAAGGPGIAIWAAGDVARYPEPRVGELVRIEHWALAERHGQAVARSMMGRGAPFDAVPFFWSMHDDVGIQVVGYAPRWDRIEVRGDLGARDATVSYWLGGRPLAVATVGRDRASLEAEALLERADFAGLAAFLARQ